MKIEGRVRQHAGLESGFGVVIEIVAEHRGHGLHGLGEQAVAVEHWLEAFQLFGERRIALLLGQGAQQVDVGTFVALGEQHVEADHGRAVVGQVVHHAGELLARERPVAVALQAGLVDGDDHDAFVHAARRADAHARVVEDVLDLVDVGNRVKTDDVAQHAGRGDDREHGPREVTLQGDVALLQEGKVHSFFIAPRMRSFRVSHGMLDERSMRSASASAGQG